MVPPAIPWLFSLCDEMCMKGLYVATLFVGAGLLFLIQPMVGNITRPHRAITRPKPQNLHFSPRMHPQDAISLFGALWGGVADNA
jgi:hypothetical protein